MITLFRERRELYAGALMVLLGAGIIAEGMTLRIGALTQMGPGFFPVVLGVMLVVLGIVIAATGARPGAEAEEPVRLDLRGGACIVLGTIAFMVLGYAFGFAAATFSAIFIAAIGDREATLRGSVALAAGLTVVGGIVFTQFLKVPFQLFHVF